MTLLEAGNRLADAGNDVAEELAAEITARYAGTLNYPSQQKRYERDMAVVRVYAHAFADWREAVAQQEDDGK